MKVATIVLFDGACNLCNGVVQFVLQHDPQERFLFAAQQSEAGQRLLARHGISTAQAQGESVVVLEGGRVYLESDAALQILHRLGGVWGWAYLFRWIPKPWRDRVYRWVARHRYRIFGKRESCTLPNPSLRRRFLDR
ncbi:MULTISPECIES: thiol-disulfide oxidoreductase DCC family protein [unclassified Meiothermus]|uniref:thiol-disulfide oxidoreductase DCC family protein n=1 Tax=unclassified Meiothermus TaxID=370471 RepID=UPI000D7CAF51|nr:MULTISPECIES: thiol-disulfide oxidoreductase DCC family protein [unclassified Meiothermus]PZA08124.1 thiol-disulfide oxidoreductase DCC [Meiothermus sp. Pnk-1]RYM31386.1 thiol-disulfide oxidoreductase DCC family protein [Meiothermus sp. PNK-Is4]